MNSLEIRQKFLDFFAKNGHTIVPSSSLIPAEDPTILFTNAGMNQFKDVFLVKETRPYKRATSIQKCVRAGGKHNDLEQVGFTERHLTFFEMMGNFSFGDYFKKEAIQFAWDFLTKVVDLPTDKLYPTVFKTDEEAFDIWNKIIGIPVEKITRLGEKDNFWQMGETGPCGPCTEIYLDRGPDKSCGKKDCAPGCDCARYFEIWNNVFMQYNRQDDGTLIPLEQTGVDTGMGLERLCMAIQKVDTVFETDLFENLIKKIESLTSHKYYKSSKQIKAAFNVLSDHVRSCSLLIADGCTPSNEGRGYVLRKIIRRAALFSQKLSDQTDIFVKLAQEFIINMSPIYPELKKSETLILKLLSSEVERFSTNLLNGQAILQNYIENQTLRGKSLIEGSVAFKLYDTYGFPLEITKVIAHENNFVVDAEGFEKEMKHQQFQSGKKNSKEENELNIPEGIVTKFVGYETLETKSKINFVKHEDGFVWVATESSPFYVESGGQVNDTAWIEINEMVLPVVDLQKIGGRFENQAIVAKLDTSKIEDKKLLHKIAVGEIAHCIVDSYARINTVKNHTATHLLQAALVQILGPQVKQAGSVVTPEYLRFDFTHHEAMSKDEIAAVENLINQKIQEDIKTKIYETTLEVAKQSGVISFFGEKYNPQKVRVVEVPTFSAELCGGTHASSTGIIGAFKITSETALSTGIRRIVAVTGPVAIKLFQQSFNIVKALSENFKSKPEFILDAVHKQQEEVQKLTSEIKQIRKQSIKSQISKWKESISKEFSTPFLYLEIDDLSNDELKAIALELEKKTPGFYFLISKQEPSDKVLFLGYLSKQFGNSKDLKILSTSLRENGLLGGGNNLLIQGGGIPKSNIYEICKNWLK